MRLRSGSEISIWCVHISILEDSLQLHMLDTRARRRGAALYLVKTLRPKHPPASPRPIRDIAPTVKQEVTRTSLVD